MKNLILTTAFLLFVCRLLIGGTNPAAQQLLITAKQQASLFHDDLQLLAHKGESHYRIVERLGGLQSRRHSATSLRRPQVSPG
jgi:hypothetical protein